MNGMRMRGALYRIHAYIQVLAILYSSPLTKKLEVNHAKIQANNSNYSATLSGGFLMWVDFLTSTLLEVLESSLLLFATVDGKIQSCNVDNLACELCSVTIQPFLSWSRCLQNILPSFLLTCPNLATKLPSGLWLSFVNHLDVFHVDHLGFSYVQL